MLAGCSNSTLPSPRHRLRSEASAQFPACHFQLPSMSTRRLDLPCSFSRKDSSQSQSIRPVGLYVEKPIQSKSRSCSLKQNIRLAPLATGTQREIKEEFWEKGKSLKRFAEGGLVEESCINRAKRKKGCSDDNDGKRDDIHEGGGDSLSLGNLGTGNFWFQPRFTDQRVAQVPFTLTCSGEEDGVCYVPGELISPPPLPLSNNPWVESVITEITDWDEKDGEETSHRLAKEVSASSTSSKSQSLALRLHENPVEHDVGNGSKNPYPYQGGVEGSEENHNRGKNQGFDRGKNQGFELVKLLTDCVEAIGSRNIPAVNHFIAKLGDLASLGGSPISRLTAYYTEALALRVTRIWPHTFHITPPRDFDRVDDDSGALRLLNQVTPIPKFIHFTANEILLRAFEGKDRVHIIDFDIKQGLQWPSLFQSLASRTTPPRHVRITGIGESKQELNDTGDRLSRFAEALNLPFEFHPVVDRLEDVRLWMLHVKEKESVAVNCIFQLHKTLYSRNGGALRDFLGLIQSTNPTIVLMGEQEAEHNSPFLETRVSNSLRYYSALFDLMDHSLPLDSPVRIKVEEMFAGEIRSIIACEGSDRLERHECFDNWRKKMEQGGFRSMGISKREMLQSRILLKMYSCENYYGVKKQEQDEAAALTLSWHDQPLYTVSAWAPVDDLSSFTQPN